MSDNMSIKGFDVARLIKDLKSGDYQIQYGIETHDFIPLNGSIIIVNYSSKPKNTLRIPAYYASIYTGSGALIHINFKKKVYDIDIDYGDPTKHEKNILEKEFELKPLPKQSL